MESCIPNMDIIKAGLQRRKQLLLSKDAPRASELYETQGKTFGAILMNQMSPLAKTLIKTDKVHTVPSHNVFIPPPDITQYRDIDKIKAFSHVTILELGEKIEKQMLKKHQNEKEKAINNNSEFERFENDQRLRFALKVQENICEDKINRFRNKIDEKWKIQQQKLQKSYDKKYQKILDEIIQTCEDKIQMEKLKMEREYQMKLQDCLIVPEEKPVLRSICDQETSVDFDDKLKKKEENIRKCEQTAKDTENICNVLQLICAEKLENKKQIEVLREGFIKKLNILKNLLEDIFKCCCCKKTRTSLTPKQVGCTGIHKHLQEVYDVAVKEIENFAEPINRNMGNFLKKATCAVVIPKHITQNVICQCQSPSSLSEDDVNCLCQNDKADFQHPKTAWTSEVGKNENQDKLLKIDSKVDRKPSLKLGEKSVSDRKPGISLKLSTNQNMPASPKASIDPVLRVDTKSSQLSTILKRSPLQCFSSDVSDTAFHLKSIKELTLNEIDFHDIASSIFGHHIAYSHNICFDDIVEEILDLIQKKIYNIFDGYAIVTLRKGCGKQKKCKTGITASEADILDWEGSGKLVNVSEDFHNYDNVPKYMNDESKNSTWNYKEISKEELDEIFEDEK